MRMSGLPIRNPQSAIPQFALQSVALRHAQHFIDRRHAGEHLQPRVFAQGSHAVLAGGLADFPTAGAVVGQLPHGIGRHAQLENALPADEAELPAAAAALRADTAACRAL